MVFAEEGDVVKKLFPEGLAFGGADQIESGEGGVGEGRRRGGGVDEGAGAVDQEIDPIAGSSEVAAGEAERLAEGAHLEMDAVLQAQLFGEAHAGEAEDAEGVGFVEEELGVVLLA